jgi:hypothetical protein
MVPNSELRKAITNPKVQKLRDWLMFYLDSTNDDGKIDLDKIINNATYNMGEAAAEIGGLIFQEKLKLKQYERAYDEARAKVYEATMSTRYAWPVTKDGAEIMVNGDVDLNKIKYDMDKQKLYVEFLMQSQENIRYYARNAKAMVDMAKFGQETGMLRPL